MPAASQTEFVQSLLEPDRALPAGLMAHTSQQPEKRFAVYRNNVVVGLANALRAKFPATERIVGEEFFGAMARIFVMAHPPRSKILRQWTVIHQGNRELRKPEQTFIGLCRMAVASLGRRSGDEPTIRAAAKRHLSTSIR